MNVWPVVVQGNSARVGVAVELDSKHVLDFPFLPVQRGYIDRVARESGIVLIDLRRYQEIAWISWKFEDMVNEKEPFGGTAILRKHSHHAGLVFVSKNRNSGTAVGIAELEINLVIMALQNPFHLTPEADGNILKKGKHRRLYLTSVTMCAAAWMSAHSGAGSQNPKMITTEARPMSEYFFHAPISA